jgi:hypothetical protein
MAMLRNTHVHAFTCRDSTTWISPITTATKQDTLNGRKLARTKRGWYDIKMDLREIWGADVDWIPLAQHRIQWRAVVGFHKMRGIS